MANNPKAVVPPDEIIYDELDQANKLSYYETIEKELKQSKEGYTAIDQVGQQEMEPYVEAYRNFYYSSEILSSAKSHEFYEEIVRQLHPTSKLKAPTKNMIKICSKVFVQELAETCFEIGGMTNRMEIDSELLTDAYLLMQKRRSRRNNVGQLFNQMHY